MNFQKGYTKQNTKRKLERKTPETSGLMGLKQRTKKGYSMEKDQTANTGQKSRERKMLSCVFQELNAIILTPNGRKNMD